MLYSVCIYSNIQYCMSVTGVVLHINPPASRFGCAEAPGADTPSVEVRAPKLGRATGPYVTPRPGCC